MTLTEEFVLLPSEKEAIEKLRAALPAGVDRKLYNDTYQLYLFLKAQKFDVCMAEFTISKYLQWRKVNQIDDIQNYTPPKVMKDYFGKIRFAYDKIGRAVNYLPAGKLDSKGIYMSTKYIDLEKTIVQMIEEEVQIAKKKRKTEDGPYPGTILLFDVEGLTFANATDKKGIENLIRILKVYQDFYPGFVESIYVFNVSTYLMIPLSIIKSCLSPEFAELLTILGTDGWKEELLNLIDADQLPAFLGGNRTDPDGNPLCITIVVQGGKIDEKEYINKNKEPLANKPGVQKMVLQRASFSENELEVKEAGSLIEWEFETKTNDIGFGLFYKEIVNDEEKITELVPLLRIDTGDYAETGVYKCEKAGTYVMLFDNSYSWIRSKEIFYRTKVVSPKEHEAEIEQH